MSATLLRTPAHNPGLSVLHNSYAVAGFSPLIFEWTRRDYDVVSVAENGGRSNQLDIVIATDITTEVSDGGTLWLEATGFYSGLVTVIGSSYSAPNTTIETTALKNAAAVAEYEFINLISDRPNYRLFCDFQGVSGVGVNTGSISSAVITPGPGPLFRMSVDASPFIRSDFDLKATPDYEEGVTFYQQVEERGFLFLVSYSELWDGNTPSASITDNFLALPAAKGSRDRYGENAIDLEVWENSLGDDYKPVLSTALPEPVYFVGWPFFAGFGMATTDEPTWQLIQKNIRPSVYPSTTYTNSIEPPGGFHLVSALNPELDDLEGLQMWIEAGVFWSLWTNFDYAVSGPAFLPSVNATAGTKPNWLFENGNETLNSAFPLPAAYSGALDGTLQEVKVTGITADQMQQFAILNEGYLYGVLSFEPCSLLGSMVIDNQSQIVEIIGPTTSSTNVTIFNVDNCDALTIINLSNTAILSGSMEITGCAALTTIAFPTVAGYTFESFIISNCTSFVQKIALGIKFPNLMGVTNSAVDLSGNGWDATTVDYYLSQLDESCPYGFTGRTIDISGNTAPTAASLGARTSLAMKGVTVTTD